MFSYKLPVGGIDATITAFDPNDAEGLGLSSWSLKPLQKQGDAVKHFRLAKALAEKLSDIGIHEAFAPNVTMASGHVVTTADLTDHIAMQDVDLYRNRDLPADGVFLNPRQAFVMSAAGCPFITASANNYFIVAHAGRESLINRRSVMHASRQHNISIVDSIVYRFQQRGMSIDDIVMVMQFAIPAREFEHNKDDPRYGAYNRALAKFVDARWPGGILQKDGTTFLDLQQVFVEQALQAGVRKVWAERSLIGFPTFAHTRDDKGADKRNLFVVRRDS